MLLRSMVSSAARTSVGRGRAGEPPAEDYDGPAELPRETVDTSMPNTSGWTVTEITDVDDLQDAINAATFPEIIELAAGDIWEGNFSLPNKGSWEAGEWIIIRTSDHASLPAMGTRVGPTADGSKFATIRTTNSDPAMDVANGAHHYRFVGIELAQKTTYTGIQYGIVNFTRQTGTTADLPTDLILDRCYVHAHDGATNTTLGVVIDIIRGAVVDSYIAEIHGTDQCKALWCYNTPGPLKVDNSYLSGSGMCFFIGGADPYKEEHVPSDITFTGNHLQKESRWFGNDPADYNILNVLELKLAHRILIEGCILENCWSDGQSGYAVIIKAENQGGGAQTWSETTDVTFRYSIIKNTEAGLNNGANVSSTNGCRRHSIHDLVIECIGGASPINSYQGKALGMFFGVESRDIIYDHLTLAFDESSYRDGANTEGHGDTTIDFGWEMRNCLWTESSYGIIGTGHTEGSDTIDNDLGGGTFEKNVMTARSSGDYPSGNFFPATNTAVKMTTYNNGCSGDYTLAGDSDYKDAGTDGKDIGADIALVASYTSGVVQETE